jgi:drug/metabolite transporter (DMT)-like permease
MFPHSSAPNHLANARLALLIAVLCVSTGAIFARVAESPALATAAWRMTIATGLVTLALARYWRDLRRISWRDLALGAGAGICLALHFATWISSLEHTTVASSVVLVNTAPLWVALLSPWVTRERTSRRAWIGMALSFVGAAVIAGIDFRTDRSALRGDALALAGGASAAVYLLLGRRLRERLSLVAYCAVTYALATAVLWAIVMVARVQTTGFPINTWGAIAGMAVIAQIGGHTLYNWSLKHLSTGAVAVALLGEPIGGTLLAWKIFGEVPPPASIGGAVLVLAGIYLAAMPRGGVRSKKTANTEPSEARIR